MGVSLCLSLCLSVCLSVCLSLSLSLFYHVVCMCVRVPLFFPPLYSVLYLKETLIWAGTPQFTSDISKKEKREKERKPGIYLYLNIKKKKEKRKRKIYIKRTLLKTQSATLWCLAESITAFRQVNSLRQSSRHGTDSYLCRPAALDYFYYCFFCFYFFFSHIIFIEIKLDI